jgi:riboflavin synthase
VFTGLIETVGTITEVVTTDAGRELRVECSYDDLSPGESIAVNGACLTVREFGAGSPVAGTPTGGAKRRREEPWFTVAAVTTTLERTTIGDWSNGTRVNLERALKVGDRLGGHFVQGHVDGVAIVENVRRHGDAVLVDLALPPGLAELMVQHGSVAVDGVSLTVNDLPAATMLQLSLIEYTLRHTTFSALAAGSRVHVEADMLGKYVQRLLNKASS